MSDNHVLKQLKNDGLVAVIRKPSQDQFEQIAESLVAGGIHILEITIEGNGALDIIEQLKKQYGNDILIGAGTVLQASEAEKAINAGSDFVFSPNCDKETIQTTKQKGAISIPGAMTPTEIIQADQAGADMVKIFPAATLGPQYLKELQGPLGHISMLPTGGIHLDNMNEFLQNGAVGIGIGGALLDKQALAENRYDLIEEKAKQFVKRFREIRKPTS